MVKHTRGSEPRSSNSTEDGERRRVCSRPFLLRNENPPQRDICVVKDIPALECLARDISADKPLERGSGIREAAVSQNVEQGVVTQGTNTDGAGEVSFRENAFVSARSVQTRVRNSSTDCLPKTKRKRSRQFKGLDAKEKMSLAKRFRTIIDQSTCGLESSQL